MKYANQQEAILDRLYTKFPLTDNHDLAQADDFFSTFIDMANISIHDHNLSFYYCFY